MDIHAQQKKLYSDPHFGQKTRGIFARALETLKLLLTPAVARGAQVHSSNLYQLKHPATVRKPSATQKEYIIFRNGVYHQTFTTTEGACQEAVMALRKKYPQDIWTYIPDHALQPEQQSRATA